MKSVGRDHKATLPRLNGGEGLSLLSGVKLEFEICKHVLGHVVEVELRLPVPFIPCALIVKAVGP